MHWRAMASVLVGISAVAVLISTGLNAAAQSASATYADPVVGVTFRGPSGLHVQAARPGVGGRTTQAIFATYAGATDLQTRVDLTRELVITAYIANRLPNEDLRAWASRSTIGAINRITDLRGGTGILVEGSFNAGPRNYAFFARGPDHILVLDAFPAFSSKINIFDGVLASLEVVR